MYPTQAVPGSVEAVLALRRRSKTVLAVTNNSLLSPTQMAQKLQRLGFPLSEDDVVTAIIATARHIAQEAPNAAILAIGSDGLKAELASQGLRLVNDDERPTYVVVGTDPDLTYQKLTMACRALLNGARFVAVNADRIISDVEQPWPGTALVVGALKAVTQRDPDVLIGKPSPILLQEAIERLGLPPSDCLMVGDNLATDLVSARQAGTGFLLVLSGVTVQADVERSPLKPDYVLSNLAELAEALATV